MKKNVFRYLAIALVIFSAISFYGWFVLFYNPFWDRIVYKIELGNDTIYLKDITNFDWDTVCVIAPYSIHPDGSNLKDHIQADLESFNNKFKNNIYVPDADNHWSFVFILNKKIIETKKKGKKYYLENNYKENCILKDNAKIVNAESTLGPNYIWISDQ